MQNQQWLPLNEYSIKYNVSISTLRRRIRQSEIEYQFRDGKYWLKDVQTPRGYKSAQPIMAKPLSTAERQSTEASIDLTAENAKAVADRLVAELKSAYVLVLQEKEEMILQLKEEVADLKTLVKILESENERYRSPSKLPQFELSPQDGQWLDEPLEP